jgi:outer membrane biosynthesis protein TonB
MRREYRQERPFPFFLALLASVALHALLLLLSPLFSLVFQSPVQARAEESVLRFSFAPTEEATEDDARPEGVVPFDVPEARPTPSTERPPDQRPSLQPPSPPQAALAPTEPPARPLEEQDPSDEQEVVEPPRDDEESRTQPEPFPADPDAPYRTETPVEPSAPGQGIDVSQALREYGEALARARAASPRSSSGGGEGRNVFVPDPVNLPPTGFGVGNLVFESRDYDWNDYARQIYWEIWKAWHNRLYDTADEFEKWMHQTGNPFLNHQVLVHFVIERDGDVTGIRVEAVSGCPPLDESAATALDEVILTPLPADFPREREVVRALFIARGEVPALRPTLRRLKAMGAF